MKICPSCLKEVPSLSRDHVCPQWFIKTCENFGIRIANKRGYEITYGKTLTNIKRICPECNSKKGGIFDLNDEYTVDLLRELKSVIERLLESL